MLVRVPYLPLRSCGRIAHFQWMWIRSSSWSSKDVRSKFIRYYEGQGHQNFPSSSVIPKKGDGTYFTNSGMNQFKPLFLDQCDPSSKLWGLTRAVNSQKCIRVGGKHNDLEDVGHDLTHHTFFEMLGSWSFGDYFKKEACQMAHQLLTESLAIPEDRLYYTYFGGDSALGLAPDNECLDIWASLGIPRERILPFGARDNFWDMGVTGPCGPCTEIHYDHIGGGRFAGSEVNTGSPDVVEIWNVVFMQYNRHVDQSLSPLPSQHVDTGMGLERMVAVINGQSDNYRTDLFTPLFDIIQRTTQYKPYQGQLSADDTAYRIMADHCRMLTVAISNGLLPSNDNLGHKLRTILHKCIHLSRRHFTTDPNVLLPALTAGVVSSLGEAYPELEQNHGKVVEVITSAIGHYDRTMDQASRSFTKMMTKVKPSKMLSASVISDLEKGRYGSAMSLETIASIAERHGMELNLEGYQQQQDPRQSPPTNTSASTTRSLVDELVDLLIEQGKAVTEDTFKYSFTTPHGTCDFSAMAAKTSPCTVLGMLGYHQGETTDYQLEKGHKGEIILDKTCFYAEAGGQTADKGYLHSPTGTFLVEDVQNLRGYVVHSGHVTQGRIAIGQEMSPEIIRVCREGNMRNHTGTHLVNTALLEVLPTTQQEGSNINPHRFTFDFLALTKVEDVEVIQSKVKDIIRSGHAVSCNEVTLAKAKGNPSVGWNKNEDYPDNVRVVSIGSPAAGGHTGCVSMELCGGTHVLNTSDIGDFCITGLSTKSQHVQRVTCVTGLQATQAHANGEIMDSMCQLLQQLHTFVQGNTGPDPILDTTQTLTARIQHAKNSSLRKLSDCGDVVEETKEDADKITTILDALHRDLEPLRTSPLQTDGCVGVMRNLVNRIHQGQHLELLPKTSRHAAHACVQDMEHKVQTLVNAGKAASLKQLLTKAEMDGCDKEPTFVTVDPAMNPRQVVKVLSKHATTSTSRPLVLLQQDKSAWSLFLSVPGDSEKPKPEQDMARFLETLQEVGSAKGKVISRNATGFVMKTSIRGCNSDVITSSVRKWWHERS